MSGAAIAVKRFEKREREQFMRERAVLAHIRQREDRPTSIVQYVPLLPRPHSCDIGLELCAFPSLESWLTEKPELFDTAATVGGIAWRLVRLTFVSLVTALRSRR